MFSGSFRSFLIIVRDLNSSLGIKLLEIFLLVYLQKFTFFIFIKRGVPRNFAVTVFNYEMFKKDSRGLKYDKSLFIIYECTYSSFDILK